MHIYCWRRPYNVALDTCGLDFCLMFSTQLWFDHRINLTSFSSVSVWKSYDPWLLKREVYLQDIKISQNVSHLSHITTRKPFLHSKPSGILGKFLVYLVLHKGSDLVVVSSVDNYCHIALISCNDCETGISSYSPELSFPLWRGYR